MPLAVSATTLSGRSASTVDERADVVGEVGEQVDVLVDRAGLVGPLEARPPATIALISARPVSSPDRRGARPGTA